MTTYFLLIDKNSQNFTKIWPKTVLFRNIGLIFSLEKLCYLENRVVREPCKQRNACTYIVNRAAPWKQCKCTQTCYTIFYVLVSIFSYKKRLTLRNKYCVTCRKLNDLYSPKTRFDNFNAFFHSFHIYRVSHSIG